MSGCSLGELNLQINSGKSVGGADLTAGEITELLERRAVIVRRIKANVAEQRAQRIIDTVNAHTDAALPRALGEFFGTSSTALPMGRRPKSWQR